MISWQAFKICSSLLMSIGFLSLLSCGPTKTDSEDKKQSETDDIMPDYLLSESRPAIKYHLTARPWQPSNVSKEAYLDKAEGMVRFVVRYQDERGAIIDPDYGREKEFATPYFACALAILIDNGRAMDLLPNGVKAMDHVTEDFSRGNKFIPDRHGNFFIAPLTIAIPLYASHVPPQKVRVWKERMAVPRDKVLRKDVSAHNWRAYAMRGEWLRAKAGYVDMQETKQWIEHSWQETQRFRFADNRWNLYHDFSSDPDSWSLEHVGRGNLFALITEGYDGPSAGEMTELIERGTFSTLYVMDPSGEAPASGRTTAHVFNDVLLHINFEIMAERCVRQGQTRWAGQFRRAAQLSFGSIDRWRRKDADGTWNGAYFVTKNQFDPKLQVGYQPEGSVSEHNGTMMKFLAMAYQINQSSVQEVPAPVEIGGYAFLADTSFATAFANAGGMSMSVSTRGDVGTEKFTIWTSLGVNRFGRVGWDSRLGPSDGAWNGFEGTSFAPTFFEIGTWKRLAGMPDRYEGIWSVQFAHPLIVRCRVNYQPKSGEAGPKFQNDFVITPDGVLSTLKQTEGKNAWGETWPILVYDGQTQLDVTAGKRIVSVKYPGNDDQQNYLALSNTAIVEETGGALDRSSYGDLLSIRHRPSGKNAIQTFVYPRSAGDPSAQDVLNSFEMASNGFKSSLGRVYDDLYVGRTSAGGIGDRIDIDSDGTDDVTFAKRCGFILQLSKGKVLAVEADQDVTATIQKKKYNLTAFKPVAMN